MYLKNLLLALAMLLALPAVAQDRKIMGMLVDADSKEPVIQASVQLLNTDSSYVAGAVSNAQGVFVVKAPKDKLYLLRISSVGYQTIVKRVKMEDMHNQILLGGMGLGRLLCYKFYFQYILLGELEVVLTSRKIFQFLLICFHCQVRQG